MNILDTDRDSQLSAEEIAIAEAALKMLDRNKDGRLTAGELSPSSLDQIGRDAAGRDAGPGKPGSRTHIRPPGYDSAEPSREKGGLGVGFLIGSKTEELIPLLAGENDFLEMMLGPEKVRYIKSLKPPARAMCISESLEGVARSIELLQQAGIAPDRVYITYNPEPRPPGARQCTPQEELDDYLGSLKKARELVKDYGAPLVMGPGLSEMAKREHLYPEMAKHCDIWMIQTQRLQLDLETDEPVPVDRYRQEVERIVELLRQGNPDIRVFAQVIPLQATPRRKEAFTAERMASYLLAIEGVIDAAKIYGGNTGLIAEVIERVRANRPRQLGRPTQPDRPVAADGPSQKRTETVEMRDGARLATDLYLPASAPANEQEPVPVVLIRTPYSKDNENAALQRWRDCLLNNGYAVAIQDMRGFYASATEGRAGPAQYDGYDTIEWLAEQPWSTGKIGMMGFSHLGAAQYEAAVTEPPHLACAIPAQAPGNYYTDSLYPPKFRKADMETILRRTFTSKTDVLLNTRIRRQNESRIDQISTPMLHSAGWYDFFKEGAIEMFNAVQHHGGPGARGTQKLLIGPWGHGVLQEENYGEPLKLPGGLAYPANAKLDWEKEVWLPWFDHWLKGEPTGVMNEPAVKYYLMGDVDDPEAPGNHWVEADQFPPKFDSTPYYIHSDHTLSTEPPSMENASISYEYDPTNPVPTVGRVHARVAITGPHDQREVETRRDVLVFTTPDLETPLKIVGPIQAKLWASSDRKDTDFTVKLTDVYPDGRSMIFLDGIVKGRFRNTYLEEEFLEPGEVVPFDIDLGFIALALAPGHRLRVAISSSSFDRWDINPNTGEPYGEHALTQSLLAERLRVDSFRDEPQYTESLVATNRVFMDASRPSHVLLPIPVEEPTASAPRQTSVLKVRKATSENPRNDNRRATTITDVPYGDSDNGVSNFLDLYLPEAAATERVPVIVAIHGGGFATGSKEMFRPKATELVKRGYAVAAINYRLKPQYFLPTQIYDAKAAIRWLRAHAEKYNLDQNRIGVLGGSAGATLAAIAGTSGDMDQLEGQVGDYHMHSSKVQAVVALAGVYREFPFFVGCRPSDDGCQELAVLCAPISHVSPDDPPFFLAIGDKDKTPQGIADHTHFHQALKENGVDSTLVIVPGAEHGHCFDAKIDDIAEFLDRHLKE